MQEILDEVLRKNSASSPFWGTSPPLLPSLRTWACALCRRELWNLACILSFYWAVEALYLNNKRHEVYPALTNSIKRLVPEHLQAVSCLKLSRHCPPGSQVSALSDLPSFLWGPPGKLIQFAVARSTVLLWPDFSQACDTPKGSVSTLLLSQYHPWYNIYSVSLKNIDQFPKLKLSPNQVKPTPDSAQYLRLSCSSSERSCVPEPFLLRGWCCLNLFLLHDRENPINFLPDFCLQPACMPLRRVLQAVHAKLRGLWMLALLYGFSYSLGLINFSDLEKIETANTLPDWSL